VSELPSVAIVIASWNGRPLLETCLPSIAALDYPRARLEVIVVDNGSTDGTVDWLAREHPGVRTIANETNAGFAAASNQGAAAARTDLVAFVNNDVRLAPAWLRSLVDALAGGEAAAAGSRIVDWEGRRYDFDGGAMNFYGHGVSLRHGRPCTDGAPGEPRPTLFACGAAMVVDRERFLAAGGFDPDYFAYFEDVDLGWRLWVQGERVLHVPGALAYHRHHGSGIDPLRHTRLLERNALASVVKNYDDASLATVLPAALALLATRARLAEPERAAAYEETMREFEGERAALEIRRARVQAARRRPDREVLPLFGEPLRPSFFGHEYWQVQREIVAASGVERLFGPGASCMDDFVDALQCRIAELERELAGARAAAAVGT
jgi:GT2 family glycosyltransferase